MKESNGAACWKWAGMMTEYSCVKDKCSWQVLLPGYLNTVYQVRSATSGWKRPLNHVLIREVALEWEEVAAGWLKVALGWYLHYIPDITPTYRGVWYLHGPLLPLLPVYGSYLSFSSPTQSRFPSSILIISHVYRHVAVILPSDWVIAPILCCYWWRCAVQCRVLITFYLECGLVSNISLSLSLSLSLSSWIPSLPNYLASLAFVTLMKRYIRPFCPSAITVFNIFGIV